MSMDNIFGIISVSFLYIFMFALLLALISLPFLIIGWSLGSVIWAFCSIAPVC